MAKPTPEETPKIKMLHDLVIEQITACEKISEEDKKIAIDEITKMVADKASFMNFIPAETPLLGSALNGLFTHSKSPLGVTFWNKIYDQLINKS